jgi:hypothetical protein
VWAWCLLRALLVVAPATAFAADVPDAAMMAPVTSLIRYMEHVEGATLPPVFAADGLVIVENFAPYVYRGSGAAARWDAGFLRHVAEGNLRELTTELGAPHDYERTGRRVYFSLPTTWRGIDRGKRFEESGAWVFVLDETPAGWRIVSYAWGVTDWKTGAAVP